MADMDSAAGTPATQNSRFEFTVRLDRDDYAAQDRHYKWTALEKFSGYLPPLVIGTAIASIGIGGWHWLKTYVGSFDGVPVGFVSFLVAVVLFWLLYWKMYVPRSIDSLFSGTPIGMGDTHFVIDRDGIMGEAVGVTVRAPWPSITQLFETKEHFVLTYSRLGGFVVPKRVFSTLDETKQFAAFVRLHATAAH